MNISSKKVITVLFFIGVLLFVLKLDSCQQAKWFERGVLAQRSKTDDSVRLWKDKYALSHYENSSLQLTLQEAKVVFDKELSKKANELNVAKNAISSSAGFKTKIQIVPGDLVYRTDTIKCKDSIAIITRVDTAQLGYIKDSLAITQYSKSKGFFKGTISMVDITSYNNRTQITNLTSFSVKDYNSRWSIGLGFGYAWPANSPQVTIGASYRLFYIGGKK